VCTYDDIDMGYQALLFCPDEKTARTVTQVLSELDFTVIPSTEPFAAVKKLMNERFDAVVVDCDNEQNATLLFKSARTAPNNQSSLAVAVVEGQAGVAKAFRIGANLVLTKPINVEQAKGTLRVARGLLRKNEAARPASPAAPSVSPAAAPAPSKPAPQAAIPRNFNARPAAPIAPPAPSIFDPKPAQQPSLTASTPLEITDADVESIEEVNETIVAQPAAATPAQPSAAKSVSAPAWPAFSEHKSSGGFAASAPAPARESKASAAVEGRSSTIISQPANESVKADLQEKPLSIAAASAAAPEFTLGSTAASETKSAPSGIKKVLLAVVATIMVAAAGYAAWTLFGKFNATQNSHPQVAAQPAATPVPVPQPAPSTSASAVAPSSASDTQAPVPQTLANSASAPPHSNKVVAPDLSKPSVSPSANKPSEAKLVPPAMIIKGDHTHPGGKAADPEAPALSVTDIVQGDAALPNLPGDSGAPAPVLQRIMVSQGVSRGLLVKQVQPAYPRTALQNRVEGSVQLLATVSKNGDISSVKVLSGDSQLARAAVEAVKQWKYKPYLLNGEPVDIQTQITVNFKLPR
jgi:periplasmic protein TonB